MKTKKFITVITICTVLFGIAGCSDNSTEKGSAASTTSKVSTTANAIEAYGTIKVRDTESVILGFPATILGVNIIDGEKVKENDTLVKLDLAEYKEQIAAKADELKTEKVTLQKLINSTGSEKNELIEMKIKLDKLKKLNAGEDPEIKKYKNSIENAKEVYNESITKLNSLKELENIGAVAKGEVDSCQATVNANKKELEDQKFSFENYKLEKQNDINDLQTKINQTKFSNKVKSSDNTYSIQIQKEKISQIEKELKLMEQKLNKSFLRDDCIISDVQNGIVSDIGYVRGDQISPENKILSIQNLDALFIEANVAEEYIKDVKLGAEVEITPVADRTKLYKGKVSKITEKAKEMNGETTITVEIDIEDKTDLLRPNYNVDLKIKSLN
jgi:multidrug resistance efflux pump